MPFVNFKYPHNNSETNQNLIQWNMPLNGWDVDYENCQKIGKIYSALGKITKWQIVDNFLSIECLTVSIPILTKK